MKNPKSQGLWEINEFRTGQLVKIGTKSKLTFPQVLETAIDEFIVLHGEKATLGPEVPTETEKEKSYRNRVRELAITMQVSKAVIQRDIIQLPADRLQKKYAIDPSDLPSFRKYAERTKQG